MLEGIRDRLDGDVPDEIHRQYEAAHRELISAMGAAQGGSWMEAGPRTPRGGGRHELAEGGVRQ